jgi:N6-adenosine-specific RNA methylase IME4
MRAGRSRNGSSADAIVPKCVRRNGFVTSVKEEQPWPFGDLTRHSYGVIVADPPWHFKTYNDNIISPKSPRWHYETMSLEAIKALPVHELAQRDALLLLWTTGWAMATGVAQDVARAWGATPVTEMTWAKRTSTGKYRHGPGYRARSMHEPILIAKWGQPKHKALPSCFDAEAGEHSVKPNQFYEIVRKKTMLLLWRCDLFSAGIERYGFESWGVSHRTDAARAAHAAAIREALQNRAPDGAAEQPPGSDRGAFGLPDTRT